MSRVVDLVIKVGGSLAREPGLARRLGPVDGLRARHRVVVVPGGGPFADVVRAQYARHALDESAAHWMGILAMDEYAHLLTDVLRGAILARGPGDIASALDEGNLPVLAPYEWLRAEDPLPHSWSVTSDSIATWVAGRLGARKLLLVKGDPARARVDDYFAGAVPAGLEWEVVTAGDAGWRPIA